MTCTPSQTARPQAISDERERIRHRAESLLANHSMGVGVATRIAPDTATDAGLSTALMDLFRRTAAAEVFECLARWVAPQLYLRIRSRLRTLGAQYDPHEILQDTLVNIYRYPDRFLPSRPGAFAAWSSTIVDNTIRRQLRRGRRTADVTISSPDLLQQYADHGAREPSLQAQDHEECKCTLSAYSLLLHCYLVAFGTLSERERFVLQMVEVRQMRYQELANVIGTRAEALKMVVFRARKRVYDRVAGMLAVCSDRSRERVLALA